MRAGQTGTHTERAKIDKNDIDFIVFATISPDYYFPGPGVELQKELGLRTIGALDIRNQCSGFVYALSIADQYIKTGMYKNILIVGSELQSIGLDMTNRGRGVSVIFGDGAGAVVMEAHQEEGMGILSTHLHADGNFAEELFMQHPGACQIPRLTPEMLDNGAMLPHMNGNLVFKHAVVRFEEAINECLDFNGYTINDVDLLIPHQANLRISNFIQSRYGLPDEKVFVSSSHKCNFLS